MFKPGPAGSPPPPRISRALEFAVGIAAVGSFAKIYGADNTTLGFQAIPTAIAIAAAGLDGIVAYTVLPNADVGPCVDIDLPRGLDHATQSTLKAIVARDGNVHAALEGDELEAALQGFGPSIEIQLWILEQLRVLYRHTTAEAGATAAILASGRGAHLLIVGLGPVGRQELLGRVAGLQDELRLKLTAAGLPDTEAAFEIKSYCRPPASPHRLEGDLGILLYPVPGLDEDPQRDLLAVLAERGRQRIEQGLLAPAFPPRLNELLREGRLIGDRRDLCLRVAARHGLELANVEQILEPQGYHAQPLGPGWHRRLEGWWSEAQEAVAMIDRALAPIRAKVETYDWNYRAGATDRRRLLAYIWIAEEEAWLTVAPGNRRVAEEAACSASAGLRSDKRLRDRAWLRRCRSANRVAAYRIQLPREPAPSQFLPAVPCPRGIENGSLVSESPEHEVWTRLPAAAPVVWGLLQETPVAANSIPAGLGGRQMRRLLVALEQVGLAIGRPGPARGGRPPIYWSKGKATLDEAAATMGVAGAREEHRKVLKKDHARDRERLLEARMGPQPRMPSLAETPCSEEGQECTKKKRRSRIGPRR